MIACRRGDIGRSNIAVPCYLRVIFVTMYICPRNSIYYAALEWQERSASLRLLAVERLNSQMKWLAIRYTASSVIWLWCYITALKCNSITRINLRWVSSSLRKLWLTHFDKSLFVNIGMAATCLPYSYHSLICLHRSCRPRHVCKEMYANIYRVIQWLGVFNITRHLKIMPSLPKRKQIKIK